ncbi:MAG: hypothetical protein K8I60_18110 [Anaerolineae bacterium]|nr:hypothetical protein [Anaerolineae bacterium]
MSAQKWLTWDKLVAITLILIMVCILLSALMIPRVGLLPPPLLPYTIYIYLFAWLPVFIVGVLLRPAGKSRRLITLVVAGLLLGVFGLALVGPSFTYTSGDCTFAPLPGQPVRYECITASNYQSARFNYVLEGREGWPFLRPVDVK